MSPSRVRFSVSCVAISIAATLFPPRVVRADEPPDRATCISAYEQGQRLRKNKKLMAARERFVMCARDPCPSAFQGECARWLGELSSELPTVVVEVRRRGALAPDSQIVVDGAPFLDKIDGVARPLDPGEHEFKVVTSSGSTLVRRETVLEGVKAQRFAFEVDPLPAEAPPSRPGPPSPLVIGLGVVGAVALGSFGYFGISGLSQRSEVEKCDPNCSQDKVDSTQRTLLFADISLGVAVVALGSAAIVWLSQGPRAASAQASKHPLSISW